jgi:hypothetical protein
METREKIHQKLNNLFFSELANSLSAPLIKKISCINKGDFNNRFDLRVAKDESQLGNWWRHPIYVIAKPSAENVVINITIQPQRWPADGEKYANDHKDSIDNTNQEINDLIKIHSINAPFIKKDIKTEGKFVLSYNLSITIDKANPTDADYSKFINFLSSLCQITVSLSDALPVIDEALIDESIVENEKEKFEEEIVFSSSKTNVDDEKESMNGIQCSDLEKIKIAFEKKETDIGQLLNDILDKYPNGLHCQINSESYEDIFEEIEKSYSILFDGNPSIEEDLNSINNNSDDDDKKWHDALVVISTELEKIGKGLYSTLSPSGGSDYVFLALNKNKYVIPLVILYHFSDTVNNASGWFDEYIEDYDISYNDFLSKDAGGNNNKKSVYTYEEKDGFFGKSFEGNARYINLNEEIFAAALAGMMAAKNFC